MRNHKTDIFGQNGEILDDLEIWADSENPTRSTQSPQPAQFSRNFRAKKVQNGLNSIVNDRKCRNTMKLTPKYRCFRAILIENIDFEGPRGPQADQVTFAIKLVM